MSLICICIISKNQKFVLQNLMTYYLNYKKYKRKEKEFNKVS